MGGGGRGGGGKHGRDSPELDLDATRNFMEQLYFYLFI